MMSQGTKCKSKVGLARFPTFARANPMALAGSQILEPIDQKHRPEPTGRPVPRGRLEQRSAGANPPKQRQECFPALRVISKIFQRRFNCGVDSFRILILLSPDRILV